MGACDWSSFVKFAKFPCFGLFLSHLDHPKDPWCVLLDLPPAAESRSIGGWWLEIPAVENHLLDVWNPIEIMGYTTNLNWFIWISSRMLRCCFFLLLFFAPAALRDDLLEVVLGSDELHSSLTRERALADFSAKVHFGQLGMSWWNHFFNTYHYHVETTTNPSGSGEKVGNDELSLDMKERQMENVGIFGRVP